MVVLDPFNLRYLSGFVSTYALVVVDPRRATLVTDGRYIESARAQLAGWDVHCLPRADIKGWWKRFWNDRRYKRLGFEGSATWNQVDVWKRQARPAKLVEAGEAATSLRIVKDAGEAAALRKAARLADEVMDGAIRFLSPGRTEAEVSRHIRRLAEDVGAQGESFANIVASGPNSSRPHHHPGNRRLRKGDMIILDLGVLWKGYCSDITRTVALGACSDEMRNVYEVCLKGQQAALQGVRDGVAARKLDDIARTHLADAGLDEFFNHGLGHGVGLEIHEAPSLNSRTEDVLKTNMAVTVEPGIYLPGKFGVRIEDLVLVGPTGPRVLSKSPKELRVV